MKLATSASYFICCRRSSGFRVDETLPWSGIICDQKEFSYLSLHETHRTYFHMCSTRLRVFISNMFSAIFSRFFALRRKSRNLFPASSGSGALAAREHELFDLQRPLHSRKYRMFLLHVQNIQGPRIVRMMCRNARRVATPSSSSSGIQPKWSWFWDAVQLLPLEFPLRDVSLEAYFVQK
ncbi:hypothetical protein SCHPADRAFT_255191 [Schizopora paradoxa]|uniref:Uncharacterized protein n=1 Tax=Schizopora paradoxa TaxID=27342 RepID=A0A0H2RUA5_9AGAM|nr:hypothetical protein SCHPADRAFT_255191 [Schizopora paradoxa]